MIGRTIHALSLIWPEMMGRLLAKRVHLTIVTGANSSHFRSLLQFLRSASTYEGSSRVVAYDLGLADGEARDLRRLFPAVDLRRFDFAKYPPHVDIRIEAGQFAWKPAIIADVLGESVDAVLWMDAGCVIRHHLYGIRYAMRRYGFYSPCTGMAIGELTHPGCYQYLEADPRIARMPMRAGGVVAFSRHSTEAMRLALRWRDACMAVDCVAPRGSNRKNHRQDQSVLSILFQQSALSRRTFTGYLGFAIHQDID